MPKKNNQPQATAYNSALLEAYHFFFDHLVDYASTDQFSEFTPDYRREWLHEYRRFAQMVSIRKLHLPNINIELMTICYTCKNKSTCPLYSLPEIQQRLSCPLLNLASPASVEIAPKGHAAFRYSLLKFLKSHLN